MKDQESSDEALRPDRRDFMKKSGVAVAGAGVMSTTALLATPTETWAQALAALDAAEVKTLLRLTRDVYPHDGLSDGIYLKVVEMLDAAAKSRRLTSRSDTVSREGVPRA